MRRLAAFIALSMAVGLLAVPTGAAAAWPPGSISTQDGVLFSGCRPHLFQFDAPSARSEWTVTVKLLDPAGRTRGLSSALGFDTPPRAVGTFSICNDWSPGVYRISAELVSKNRYGFEVERENVVTDFTMRRPRTTTSLVTRTKRKRVVLRVTTREERTEGYAAASSAQVRIQRKVKGKWRAVKGGRGLTNVRGVAKVRVKYPRKGRQRFRAITVASGTAYTGSTSGVVKVRAKDRPRR